MTGEKMIEKMKKFRNPKEAYARHFRRKELITEAYHEVRNAMFGQLELFKKSHVLRT